MLFINVINNDILQSLYMSYRKKVRYLKFLQRFALMTFLNVPSYAL
jgi:hypothetical protein